MIKKNILFNMTAGELEQFVVGMGQPKFRAKQIGEWLQRGAPDFFVMKNLPDDLRKKLDEIAVTLPVQIKKKLESSDNQTTKFLLQLADGQSIETVLMRTSYGNSVCVSSQAGCAMGCKFCASTLLGLNRNLTVNEMIAQVLACQWELRECSKGISRRQGGGRQEVQSSNKINPSIEPCTLNFDHPIKPNGDANNGDVSHIVVMGTGEPLQNTGNLFGFLEYAHAKLGISWRRITVSTCGIVPGIEQMITWGRPVNLAISLHAPSSDLRSQIMPINAKYDLENVLDAAFRYTEKSGRQLMIEYILLGGLNDTEEMAEKLATLLKNRLVMVNLIPWNPVDERHFNAPSGNTIHKFQDILIKNSVHTRIRRERGADIGSACGQLRLRAN